MQIIISEVINQVRPAFFRHLEWKNPSWAYKNRSECWYEAAALLVVVMSPHYRETVGGGGGHGEEDPLQGPRPPERLLRSSQEQNNLLWRERAKRLSCRLSERASVLWGGWAGQEDDPPPPVPRHRTEPSKYEVVVSDRNHVRLLHTRTRSYTCKELLCIVFVPCLLICILGIVCSSLVIHHVLGKVR